MKPTTPKKIVESDFRPEAEIQQFLPMRNDKINKNYYKVYLDRSNIPPFLRMHNEKSLDIF